MKWSILIVTVMMTGLCSCSKDRPDQPVKTYSREEMLCAKPWHIDINMLRIELNGKVVEDNADSVHGLMIFKADHTLEILIPGEDLRKVFWNFNGDLLTVDNTTYQVNAFSGTRLWLQRNYQKMVPNGIAFCTMESRMSH